MGCLDNLLRGDGDDYQLWLRVEAQKLAFCRTAPFVGRFVSDLDG